METTKITGFNEHRLQEGDPHHETEVKLHELFNKYINTNSSLWELAIFGCDNFGRPRDYLSDREFKIAASLVQWLGTPVGKSFLKDAGFEYKNDRGG